MSSADDTDSSTDWKAKYNEVADMLAETRAELDEFHTSSKDLEEELIKEIERTEKAQQDLRIKLERADSEKEDWKSKFVSLQTTHNTTTTSLQRELDTVRQESQRLKVQLRELELGNDDLERNERAVSSTLADVEGKYSRVLEEKILLEHELLDKASLEEECQRLKDDLRDTNLEVSILRDQLAVAQAKVSREIEDVPGSNGSSALFSMTSPPSTDESLLNTPPPDFQLSELESKTDISTPSRPHSTSLSSSTSGQSIALHKAGFHPKANKPTTAAATTATVSRSRTLPSGTTRSPPQAQVPRPIHTASSSIGATSAIPVAATKSRGVQMVSEMRARVRNLEQKIHTRVPRLRMGSNDAHQNPLDASALSPSASSTSYDSRASTLHPTPAQSVAGGVSPRRRSGDSDSKAAVTPSADNSGWVLIMDETPSPSKDPQRQIRRVSSPTAPSAYSRGITPSTSTTTYTRQPSSLYHSTAAPTSRRPQSRLSGGSQSTTATVSSIPTPSSRPATPTFFPILRAGLNNSPSPSRRPVISHNGQTKRSSLGSSATHSSSPDRTSKQRPVSYSAKSPRSMTQSQSNVTIRPSTRLPTYNSTASGLGQSRISRPPGSFIGRKNGGLDFLNDDSGGVSDSVLDKRSRVRPGQQHVRF
ncbi:hypothetical protein CONPUDRAFT_86565 [Coniophora puteana RWD-64-598 SS2]|uniref:NUDE domain-containing protein n=1 Tax=Coniophora puteana (strain RWD-64-598) TaxID=741705 RepID=A0A5M3N6Y5_CONPW|nr:uncharacterized protein CONPUDRAFT_86565 [Coniophora puteana RWD-64-598 SS2]EIW86605.1 hypothetical protein CONPUDRAFT_86565 [Coniophora puteana RWD-64-598 SS2]